MAPPRTTGRADQAARRALAPLVAAGTHCWRCGLPITPDQPWDAGHLDDIATGGHPNGPRLPEHRLKRDCPAGGNRANGAQLATDLRRQTSTRRRRLVQWLRFFWSTDSTGKEIGRAHV